MDDAESELGYRIFTPRTALASDDLVTHVWVGSEEPGGKDMLPTTPQATIAIAYSTGVQVRYVPWVYGVEVPPFSQASNAESYATAASQDELTSLDRLSGVPVRVMRSTETSGPGSVEMNLGTSNADAVTIVVVGFHTSAELEDVARSIIDQWLADHPEP